MDRQQGGQRSKGTHHDLLFGALPKHVFSGTIIACLLELKNGYGHPRLQIGRVESCNQVNPAAESV